MSNSPVITKIAFKDNHGNISDSFPIKIQASNVMVAVGTSNSDAQAVLNNLENNKINTSQIVYDLENYNPEGTSEDGKILSAIAGKDLYINKIDTEAIIDSLDSYSADQVLSANKGRQLYQYYQTLRNTCNNLSTDIQSLIDTRKDQLNLYNDIIATDVLNIGYALDARQGVRLNDIKIDKDHIVNNLTTSTDPEQGDYPSVLDARQGYNLNQIKVTKGRNTEGGDIVYDLDNYEFNYVQNPDYVQGGSQPQYIIQDDDKVLSAFQGKNINDKINNVLNIYQETYDYDFKLTPPGQETAATYQGIVKNNQVHAKGGIYITGYTGTLPDTSQWTTAQWDDTSTVHERVFDFNSPTVTLYAYANDSGDGNVGLSIKDARGRQYDASRSDQTQVFQTNFSQPFIRASLNPYLIQEPIEGTGNTHNYYIFNPATYFGFPVQNNIDVVNTSANSSNYNSLSRTKIEMFSSPKGDYGFTRYIKQANTTQWKTSNWRWNGINNPIIENQDDSTDLFYWDKTDSAHFRTPITFERPVTISNDLNINSTNININGINKTGDINGIWKFHDLSKDNGNSNAIIGGCVDVDNTSTGKTIRLYSSNLGNRGLYLVNNTNTNNPSNESFLNITDNQATFSNRNIVIGSNDNQKNLTVSGNLTATKFSGNLDWLSKSPTFIIPVSQSNITTAHSNWRTMCRVRRINTFTYFYFYADTRGYNTGTIQYLDSLRQGQDDESPILVAQASIDSSTYQSLLPYGASITSNTIDQNIVDNIPCIIQRNNTTRTLYVTPTFVQLILTRNNSSYTAKIILDNDWRGGNILSLICQPYIYHNNLYL